MIYEIDEYDFMLEYADKITEEHQTALLIIINDYPASVELLEKLKTEINDTDIMILVLNYNNTSKSFCTNFGIPDDPDVFPLMSVYIDDEEVERINKIDIDTVYETITDIEESEGY